MPRPRVSGPVSACSGGALTDLVSWRAAFLVNVPIAVAMVIGARAVLIETPRRPGQLDVPGAVCATLGVGALVFGTIESAHSGWGSSGSSPPSRWPRSCWWHWL